MTLVFGHRHPGEARPTLYAGPVEEDPIRDGRDGVYYPASRIETDGRGRNVAEKHRTDRPLRW